MSCCRARVASRPRRSLRCSAVGAARKVLIAVSRYGSCDRVAASSNWSARHSLIWWALSRAMAVSSRSTSKRMASA